MGIGSSSICALAVVTSSALPALTDGEADYYMVGERIVAPPEERFPTGPSPFEVFCLPGSTPFLIQPAGYCAPMLDWVAALLYGAGSSRSSAPGFSSVST